jgi:hypothetical protein
MRAALLFADAVVEPLPEPEAVEVPEPELAELPDPEAVVLPDVADGEEELALAVEAEEDVPDVAGGVGPRLAVMSRAIRVSTDRASVLCSTTSRAAWACRNCTLTATYKAPSSSTAMAEARRTSSSV